MGRKPKWKNISFKTYKVKLPEFTAQRLDMFLNAKSTLDRKLTSQDFFEGAVIEALNK
jgi:hypothetical protein